MCDAISLAARCEAVRAGLARQPAFKVICPLFENLLKNALISMQSGERRGIPATQRFIATRLISFHGVQSNG